MQTILHQHGIQKSKQSLGRLTHAVLCCWCPNSGPTPTSPHPCSLLSTCHRGRALGKPGIATTHIHAIMAHAWTWQQQASSPHTSTRHVHPPPDTPPPPPAPTPRAEGESLSRKAGDLEASLRKLRQAHSSLESERDKLSSRVKLLEVQLLEAQDTAASTGQHAALQVGGTAVQRSAGGCVGAVLVGRCEGQHAVLSGAGSLLHPVVQAGYMCKAVADVINGGEEASGV
jgi:hypothetical protein